MPWTMNDYPSSLKNLPKATRKKAIDIANALMDEGYREENAIPIATKQAEEWYHNATEEEREDYLKSLSSIYGTYSHLRKNNEISLKIIKLIKRKESISQFK